jgi:hypothetical protein
MTALHDVSAHELSSAYRTRQVSPVDVTRAAIEAWHARTRRRRRAPGRNRRNRTQ